VAAGQESTGNEKSVGSLTEFLVGAAGTAFGCFERTTPIGELIAIGQATNDLLKADVACNGPVSRLLAAFINALDPNDKSGTQGVGAAHYFIGSGSLPYVIHFENKDTATAPAQTVTVTDQLDPAKFDLSTFSFLDATIGGTRLAPAQNSKAFGTDVDLRPANNIIARVSASIDPATGLITWQFQSIDPATGQPATDPTAGFLPPNKVPPQGEGSLMFTVKLKSGLPTDTRITNNARVVFDQNAPIDTPVWTNTIDTTPPGSSVRSLPASVSYSFPVLWSGADPGSGIATYTVYVSDNNAAFQPWLQNTSATGGVFTGQNGHTYRFYSIALDAVGNQEPAKSAGETSTTVNAPAGNAVDDVTFYVSQHYRDFLNRQPDVPGFNFWTTNITSCGSDTNCRDVKRVDTSAAFFLSIEFQQTGYLVERMYKTAYGDRSGSSTFGGAHTLAVPIVSFTELVPDTELIGHDVVVNQGDWQTQLELNKQSFAAIFVQRSRFISAFATTLTPAQFVDQLFANAGVTPSPTDRTAAINEFGSATNTSDAAARARALRDVAENQTLQQREFNRAFVLMQYFGYLRRDPNSGPDTDYTGYDFWLAKLNQFNGNYVSAEMVKAFIASTEYRQRFGS